MAIAATTGVVAIGHAAASLWTLEVEEVVEDLRAGKMPDEKQLSAAFAASRTAAQLADQALHRTQAATILLAMPGAARQSQATQGVSEESLVKDALEAAPANPYNWGRLAMIRYARGDFDGARKALLQSIAMGRYAPNLAGGRARLALALSDRGQTGLATIAKQQILFAAASQPELLARYHRDTDFVAYCHRVLVGNREPHLAFIKALRQARKSVVHS